MTATKTPTTADLNAILPAIEALARATPYGVANIRVGNDDRPTISIELPMPSTNPMTIAAEVRYGGTWKVEASGWSWTAKRADDLRLAAAVLQTAHAIVALLESIG